MERENEIINSQEFRNITSERFVELRRIANFATDDEVEKLDNQSEKWYVKYLREVRKTFNFPTSVIF